MVEVLIISGSGSDEGLVKKAEDVLEGLGIEYESHVASAHREPEKLKALVKGSDAKVFIGIAGLSAALPGAIASYTKKPVIGVPRDVKLEGLDALLSIMQMPPGVPVATVGVDNAANAAYLAARILAVGDEGLRKRLEE